MFYSNRSDIHHYNLPCYHHRCRCLEFRTHTGPHLFWKSRSDIHHYNLACYHHPRRYLHSHIRNHTLLSPKFQSSRSLGQRSAGRY